MSEDRVPTLEYIAMETRRSVEDFKKEITEKNTKLADQVSRIEESLDQHIKDTQELNDYWKGMSIGKKFLFGILAFTGSVVAILWGCIQIFTKVK